MENTAKNQVIALSGLAQSVSLVNQIATLGNCDPISFEACIRSVLKLDAADITDVYGNLQDLQPGFMQLKVILTGQDKDARLPARYATMLMVLQSKLMKNRQMQNVIRSSLLRANEQADFFSTCHSNVIASIAGTYQETISTLKPRVLINGNRDYLARPDQANRVRALLMAGIRSVVLWEQCGGKRWKLLFNRNRLIREIDQFL